MLSLQYAASCACLDCWSIRSVTYTLRSRRAFRQCAVGYAPPSDASARNALRIRHIRKVSLRCELVGALRSRYTDLEIGAACKQNAVGTKNIRAHSANIFSSGSQVGQATKARFAGTR